MALAVMFCAHAKDEGGEDETERPLLFRRQDENLAPALICARFQVERRLTWSERYLCRMFWS